VLLCPNLPEISAKPNRENPEISATQSALVILYITFRLKSCSLRHSVPPQTNLETFIGGRVCCLTFTFASLDANTARVLEYLR
jgi:hypothetical protein